MRPSVKTYLLEKDATRLTANASMLARDMNQKLREVTATSLQKSMLTGADARRRLRRMRRNASRIDDVMLKVM